MQKEYVVRREEVKCQRRRGRVARGGRLRPDHRGLRGAAHLYTERCDAASPSSSRVVPDRIYTAAKGRGPSPPRAASHSSSPSPSSPSCVRAHRPCVTGKARGPSPHQPGVFTLPIACPCRPYAPRLRRAAHLRTKRREPFLFSLSLLPHHVSVSDRLRVRGRSTRHGLLPSLLYSLYPIRFSCGLLRSQEQLHGTNSRAAASAGNSPICPCPPCRIPDCPSQPVSGTPPARVRASSAVPWPRGDALHQRQADNAESPRHARGAGSERHWKCGSATKPNPPARPRNGEQASWRCH
ncbi:hypothetical protein DFH07DRAFT_812795 [Mycena maculata]|uniref:Uncharacterized protein n=1 Tax=Mycena maculata TaxID=230809 RepID=A0AAD7JF96_9AGAR|nr:hypothetical protein DFH07DRAFT_812795 [Mycena maculata]